MDNSYNEHHIKLMHSNGTTAYETLFVILPSPLHTFLTVLLASFLTTSVTKQKKWQFIMEFLFLVMPIILSITVLTKYVIHFLLATCIIVANLLLLIYNSKTTENKFHSYNFNTKFLTNARSTINILSVIAILAVDFKIFPRRFAKTDFFGYSLMDVGVGLFMYSNGIVAPEARGQGSSIKKNLKNCLPLFVVGGIRLIFINQTDYYVPVSEYGVHWNFFFTLGLTKLFSSFILSVIKPKYIVIIGSFILIAHEVLLQSGLQNFVLIDIERTNFIKANKEGLVSCLGYICIYLYSIYFGYLLNLKNNQHNNFFLISLKFIMATLLTLVLSIIMKYYFGVSRRLTNSAYCFWILFIGIFMTGLYYLGQIIQQFIFKDKLAYMIYNPLIFEAINYNGLIFFLLGNILTGLINMTLNTLTINNSFSLVILTFYMFVNCFVVTLLFYNKIKLKL